MSYDFVKTILLKRFTSLSAGSLVSTESKPVLDWEKKCSIYPEKILYISFFCALETIWKNAIYIQKKRVSKHYFMLYISKKNDIYNKCYIYTNIMLIWELLYISRKKDLESIHGKCFLEQFPIYL